MLERDAVDAPGMPPDPETSPPSALDPPALDAPSFPALLTAAQPVTSEPVEPVEPVERATTRHRVTVAGVLGEILMTLGVLVLLFVGWQLWWTDLEAERAQADDVRAMEQRFDAAVPVAPRRPAAEPVSRASSLVSSSTAAGTSFAVVRIPRFGAGYHRPVIQGTDSRQLALGIGHIPSSVMPGQIGNFATAGHRVTYGKPYNRIDELVKNDAAVVETADGWSVYRFERHRIVRPEQVEVVAPVPDRPGVTPTTAWMTMVACHPKFSADKRYIGYLRLERFVPRTGPGVPATVQRALQPPTGVR